MVDILDMTKLSDDEKELIMWKRFWAEFDRIHDPCDWDKQKEQITALALEHYLLELGPKFWAKFDKWSDDKGCVHWNVQREKLQKMMYAESSNLSYEKIICFLSKVNA